MPGSVISASFFAIFECNEIDHAIQISTPHLMSSAFAFGKPRSKKWHCVYAVVIVQLKIIMAMIKTFPRRYVMYPQRDAILYYRGKPKFYYRV